MATLIEFIKKLNPRIKKSTVQSDLENTIKELSLYALPMVKSMADTSTASPFKSEWIGVFESNVRDNVKFARKGSNIWIDLYAALTNTLANAEKLKTFVDAYLQEDTLKDGITARASHMVRLAAAISFVTAYTAEVCDYTLSQESIKLGDENGVPPAQEKYIRGNVQRFATLLADVSIAPGSFEKLFNDIPEVFVSEKNMAAIASMYGEAQLDPFKKIRQASGWQGSPIYTARLMWETYQADRYHAMKDRKIILNLRLIHLQNQQAQSPNPRLQSEIDGLQARLNKYDRKIREVEESVFGS